MNLPATAKLRIGDWRLDPAAGQISRGGEVVRLEARTLRLLLELADRAGEVVSIDELLDRVWAGVIVTPDSVYQAVAALRRLFGDDPKQPRYIATVPRLGYRLVAEVQPWSEAALPAASDPRRRRSAVPGIVAGAALAAVVLAGAIAAYELAPARRAAPVARASVGVAPFVDLTPTMDQDQLADEMTEGVADQLSRDPSLRTPGFRSSFYLIGKHTTLAQAAHTLGVAYVVDGGVRRSGGRVRVSARLVRADSGLIVWSQTYERPLGELADVQGAVAGAVAKALATTRAAN